MPGQAEVRRTQKPCQRLAVLHFHRLFCDPEITLL
jgi:hypothetical protein